MQDTMHVLSTAIRKLLRPPSMLLYMFPEALGLQVTEHALVQLAERCTDLHALELVPVAVEAHALDWLHWHHAVGNTLSAVLQVCHVCIQSPSVHQSLDHTAPQMLYPHLHMV